MLAYLRMLSLRPLHDQGSWFIQGSGWSLQHFLSLIDVFDNEVKRNDYKPMIHNDSATISLGLMNIACTLLIFIKQLHLFKGNFSPNNVIVLLKWKCETIILISISSKERNEIRMMENDFLYFISVFRLLLFIC